ncbi:MAG: HAD hydrolase family protein [Archangium sp.]|nr:HAD hydrolase family protein [Archangium sp.]
MQYRLLALDLDGTLLQRDGSVHPKDLAAIARVRAAGVAVTICTGRLYSGSRHVAEWLDLEGPVGCVDGSQVMMHSASGSSALQLTSIHAEHALHLRDLLGRRDAARFFVANDRIVHDAAGALFAPYVSTWTGTLEETGDLHAHPLWEDASGLLAAIVVGQMVDIEATAAEIRTELGAHAHLISFPLTRFEGLGGMVVRAPGPTKGTALRSIGTHLGIGVHEMVAVGDWFNDKPMFEVVGRSFAMKKAPDEVRALATDQVNCELQDGGVAEVIERVFG